MCRNKLIFLLLFFNSITSCYAPTTYSAHNIVASIWNTPVDECVVPLESIVDWLKLHEHDLLDLRTCPGFVGQCKQIHTFFTHTYVDLTTNSLCYFLTEQHATQQMQPLLMYLDSIGTSAHIDFYAFYFCAVARLFIAAVQCAHEHKGDDHLYTQHRAQAEQYNQRLTYLLPYVQGSEYEQRYALQCARYHELLGLL